MKTIDHKGNEFKSVSEMCRYWGVSSKLFYSRHKHCRDLEYCLSPKKVKGGRLAGVPVEDHLGNKFESKQDLAQAYGLTLCTLHYRMSKGWSLEDVLTKPVNSYTPVTEDHKGNKYPTFKAMCDAYGLPEHVVSRRLTHYKFSLEDALTKPKHKRGERFWDDAARQDGYGVRRLSNTGGWVLEKVD